MPVIVIIITYFSGKEKMFFKKTSKKSSFSEKKGGFEQKSLRALLDFRHIKWYNKSVYRIRPERMGTDPQTEGSVLYETFS